MFVAVAAILTAFTALVLCTSYGVHFIKGTIVASTNEEERK